MAPPIVRTISRYLLRQHVAPLGFALAALTSLMLIQQIAKQLSSLLGKGLPTSVIIEVFLLSVPFIVAVTLPMAVLVAVLHVFTRLAGDNEITALQAGGVSVGRVIAPALTGAAGIALLSFLWNDQLLPRTNHQLRTLQMDIQRKKPSLALKEQVMNEVVAGQFFLRAARIDGSANTLKDVTIYDLADAERRRIITADSGRMAHSGGGRGLYLTLQHRHIEELRPPDPAPLRRPPRAHPPSPSPPSPPPGLPAPPPPLIGRRSGTDHAAVRDRHADHARGGRQRAAATARGARARRGVRGRDPEEVRDRGGLPGVRTGGRTDRVALPARRRGARARRERRGVHDLLYRLDRG